MYNAPRFVRFSRRVRAYSRRPGSFALTTVLTCIITTTAFADAPSAPAPDPSARAQSLIDKALAFLKSQQQPDGSWQRGAQPPAISAIVLKAFVADPNYANDPLVTKGFEKLLSYQKPDGGIYNDMLANYNTA